MKFQCVIVSVLLGLAGVGSAQEPGEWEVTKEKGTRFRAVEVYIDAGVEPLAAYQVDFRVGKGAVKIVGIEGGESAAFEQPPYYDPKAIQDERVTLAAFNTAKAELLPTGKTRVATLHLQITGSRKPEYILKLQAAANANGETIPVTASLKPREAL